MKFDIFISAETKKRITDALLSNIHAIIIESPFSNQHKQINALVEYTTGIPPDTSLKVEPKNISIGIDEIKNVRLQFSLKNHDTKKRLVFINYAEKMTHEAQNALLKILEEPPEGTVFIINTASMSSLLPTVISRCVSIILVKPNKQNVKSYFHSQGFSKEKIDKAMIISDGWPELAESILVNETNDFMEVLNYAKELLRYPLAKKLKEVDKLYKQKNIINTLLFVLERLSHATHKHHIQHKGSVDEKWFNIIQAVERAQYLYKHNVNNKVLLTELMASI